MREGQRIEFEKIRFVFLDRDGVLNRKPPNGGYITRCEDFALLAGVADAVAAINRSGRKVLVVSNQRGIALGLYSRQELARIHDKLRSQLAERDARVDGIYVCTHDVGECDCRKPQTGLFEQARADFPEAVPKNSIMVGDSLRDIEAGRAWGMPAIFIRSIESPAADEAQAMALAVACASSLAELVESYVLGPHD